jgi:hypothetical protein
LSKDLGSIIIDWLESLMDAVCWLLLGTIRKWLPLAGSINFCDILIVVAFSLTMLCQVVNIHIQFYCSCQGGDSGSKRPKFDQDGSGDIVVEPHLSDDKPMRLDQESSSSSHRDSEASTSTSMKPVKTEETGAGLPEGLNDMKISDDKVDGHNDKVIFVLLPMDC